MKILFFFYDVKFFLGYKNFYIGLFGVLRGMAIGIRIRASLFRNLGFKRR